MQEFPRESIAVSFFHRQVKKVASLLIDNIMVTDDLSSLLLLSNDNIALIKLTGQEEVSKANESFYNKVHFGHLLVFLIDYAVDGVLFFEFTGKKAQRDLVHEFFVSRDLLVEETLARVENVREKVALSYLFLYAYWYHLKHSIMAFKAAESIIGPKVVHVYLDFIH